MLNIFVVIGILTGAIIYILVVRPFAVKTCLIEPGKCIQLEYQLKDNTALVHDISTGHYMWFVEGDILLYGEPTGRICKEGEPTYVWDLLTNKPRGYLCAQPIEVVKRTHYHDVPIQKTSIKTHGTFGMFEMVNALVDKNILRLPKF